MLDFLINIITNAVRQADCKYGWTNIESMSVV